jgi:hypothetical protein
MNRALSVLVGAALHDVVLHPVKLELVWTPQPDMDNLSEALGNSGEEDESVLTLIEELGWDAVVLPKRRLTVFSKKTGNMDRRGGGCGNYAFTTDDFVWEVTNEGGITFRELVEGAYRMKGSKYDMWYEMYSEIKLIREDDQGYTMEVRFGYGS